MSYVLCGCFVLAVYYAQIAISANRITQQYVAAFISIVNAILPQLVKKVTDICELHVTNSSMQLSSMLKLSVVRCFNTGILVYLTVRDVLGYDKTFHQDALKQIQGILIADAVSGGHCNSLLSTQEFGGAAESVFLLASSSVTLYHLPGNVDTAGSGCEI